MKKLKKILLSIILISFISNPLNVLAEPETPAQPKTEEATPEGEVTPEGEATPEEEATLEESIKVDEDNEDPFLFGSDENEDQTNREKEIIKKPIDTPASVTGEKYNGSGTVVDFTTTGSKAFYTVKGADNSIFYIVIDMDKTENNVYFLSEINGEELSLEQITSQKPTPAPTPTPDNKKENKKGVNGTFWIVLFGAIALFGYQLTYGKLKNLNPLTKKEDKIEEDELSDENIHRENDIDEDDNGYLVDDDE